MGLAYDMIYTAIGLATSPVWVYRLASTGKWRTDWPGRFGRCEAVRRDGRAILLVHAVSVGEVNAIAKLVEAMDSRSGGAVRVVVSVTTDMGTARARQLFEPRHRVVRFPLDFGVCVKRFLDAVRPDVVALTELEVWPNFVQECEGRGVPVCVINGRLSERSGRWYKLIAPFVRPTFSKLSAVAAQTRGYADRFVGLGVPADKVQVLDSMKWDTAAVEADAGLAAGAEALAKAMGIDRDRPVIVAGSTGPGEERLLIDQCPKDAQLVLVPRKPERFDEVAALAGGMVRRSGHPDGSDPPGGSPRLFLLDTMGELAKAYALADVAIVGRSFLGLYGSNPMEPVALGRATIIGPCYSDFADTVEALREGGGIVVTDEPGRVAGELLADRDRACKLGERGLAVIRERQGATERHAEMLFEMLTTVR